MDNKNRKDWDKYLQKFAVKGQEKLVGQLRLMLNSKQGIDSAQSGESDKSPAKKVVGRKLLFDLMDSIRDDSKNNNQLTDKPKNIYFEVLCKPVFYPDKIDPADLEKTQQKISDSSHDSFEFSVFIPESGIFYARNITTESKQNKPDIFDPKVQSLMIAETLISLGRLYQNLGLNFRDRFDIVFRYNNAVNLAIGSIGPETFLPSIKYNKEELTFYVVRELHEILGQTGEMASEIIIELLKKLRYQGIVNRQFFIHTISKHMAKNNSI